MRKTRTVWKSMLVLAGLLLLAAAAHAQKCVVPDDGSGTVTLPPSHCKYVSPAQLHQIINGLPPGTTIILKPTHWRFFCKADPCEFPGGILGGHVERFGSTATFQLSGTGALAGWTRTVTLPVDAETHTGPRPIGARVQDFPTSMQRMEGALSGDPDFQYLRIVAGGANGYESPGHTTLTRRTDGQWDVVSRFNISYRIDFQGAPGGRLEGAGGSTEGTVEMAATNQ